MPPAKPIEVVIGIQARSSSRRFPGKISKLINRLTVLDHVIKAADNAAKYINNWGSKNVSVQTAILVPEHDPIIEVKKGKINIVEGLEHDVLSRYVTLQKALESDYIVRLTADCPLIPPYLISKLITIAVMNKYDYLSNVDERCRTAVDGHDVEVLSARMLAHLDKTVSSPSAREHVTVCARLDPPPWADVGSVVNFLDLSHLKLSIDTPEDLVRVRQEYLRAEKHYERAVKLFGKNSVHRV